MDFFGGDPSDLFTAAPLEGGRRRRRSTTESAAFAVASLLLPVLDFAILLAADLWPRPIVALIVFPLTFTALAWLLARRLELETGPALHVALVALIWCGIASFGAMVVGFFGSL